MRSLPIEGFRILIVDDHWISASGLSGLLGAAFAGVTCEIFTTLQDLLKRVDTANFNAHQTLVIADFWLVDGTALSLLEAFQGKQSASKVIVLSGDSNPELARKVLEKGAWAFCEKTAPAAPLVTLIGRALANEPPPLHAPALQGNTSAAQSAQLISLESTELGLTPRQGAVLKQVLAGRANKVIANALGIQEQTVKEHVTALLERFGVENRVALIRLFADRRLTLDAKP